MEIDACLGAVQAMARMLKNIYLSAYSYESMARVLLEKTPVDEKFAAKIQRHREVYFACCGRVSSVVNLLRELVDEIPAVANKRKWLKGIYKPLDLVLEEVDSWASLLEEMDRYMYDDEYCPNERVIANL